MNIQFAQSRSTGSAARGTGSRVWSKMWIASKVAFFCIVAAALFNVNIYLRQKISETNRNIRRLDHEIDETNRDLERLRADYAELTSWQQIHKRIVELNLPLSAPRPGQIQELTLPAPGEYMQYAGKRRRAGRMAKAK